MSETADTIPKKTNVGRSNAVEGGADDTGPNGTVAAMGAGSTGWTGGSIRGVRSGLPPAGASGSLICALSYDTLPGSVELPGTSSPFLRGGVTDHGTSV